MHGQKKRRKRTASGTIEIDGVVFAWVLLSEPQYTTEHGLRGLRFSVDRTDDNYRQLLIEYPFKQTTKTPQLPQRPQFTVEELRTAILAAAKAGWDPSSRGKAFIYRVSDGPLRV